MKKLILIILFIFFSNTSVKASLSAHANVINDACNSGTGSIFITVNGGANPYTFLWSPNGLSSQSIQNLYAGTYSCTITDAVGSTVVVTANVNNDNFLDVGYQQDLSSGFDNNGNYIVVVHNGLFPQIGWDCLGNNLSGSSNVLTNISPFSPSSPGCGLLTQNGLPYNVHVSDINGCAYVLHDTLRAFGFAKPTPIIYGACHNSSNGQIHDTLETYDDSLNFNWSPSYYSIFLYKVGITSPKDSIINSNNPIYAFNSLSAGDYVLKYYSRNSTLFRTVYITVPDLGTACGTVSGNIFVDLNNNCLFDLAEPKEQGAIVEISPGPYYTNTDQNGNYSIDLNIGSYTLQHTPQYNGLLGVRCPIEPYPFSILTGSNTVINLTDTSPGIDLMSYVNITTLRPGKNGYVFMSLYNLSAVPSNVDSIILHFDPLLVVNSTDPIADSVAPGYAKWTIPVINALNREEFNVYIQVPNNPNLIGTYVTANSIIYPFQGDINPLNNNDSSSKMIIGSYDPNHKSVHPEGFGEGNWVPITTPYFDYQIEFQNTGNDTAFNIVIVDTLDSKFDFNTFIPLSSSHDYTWQIGNSGKITYTFNDINLLDSGRSEEGSKGFINYRISLKSSSVMGDTLNNTAWIYFDLNPPIATNTSSLILFDCDSIIAQCPDTLLSCEHDNFDFIAPTRIPSSITWTIDGSNFGVGDTLQLLSILPLGTHVIEMEASNPYCSQHKQFTWDVLSNPVVTTSVNGDTLSCLVPGSSYQWYISDIEISNAIDSFYVASISGNYSVVVTNLDGCSSTSSIIHFVATGIGSKLNSSDVICWPNPAFDELHIRLQGQKLTEPQINIYDQLGQLVLVQRIDPPVENEDININVKNLPTGIYHLELRDKQKQFKQNWIKN